MVWNIGNGNGMNIPCGFFTEISLICDLCMFVPVTGPQTLAPGFLKSNSEAAYPAK